MDNIKSHLKHALGIVIQLPTRCTRVIRKTVCHKYIKSIQCTTWKPNVSVNHFSHMLTSISSSISSLVLKCLKCLGRSISHPNRSYSTCITDGGREYYG